MNQRAVDTLRLLSALCGLALAVLLFRAPLGQTLGLVKERAEESLGIAGRGFMVQIVSQPTGAEVEIDGRSLGPTPFFGNVICRQDQVVVIRVRSADHAPWEKRVACREGGSLSVTAQLVAK